MAFKFNPLSGKFDIVETDHTKLSNIGTNTHAQIDTALGTTIPATYATKALDNLASVAINTSLVSDTDSTDNLGSSTVAWANLYVDSLYVPNTQSQTNVKITGYDLASTRHQGIQISNTLGYAYLDLKGNSNDGGRIIFESDNYTKAAGAAGEINYFADDLTIQASDSVLIIPHSSSGFYFSFDGNIFRYQNDSAADLGAPAQYWANTYTDKIYLNSTATLNGATAGIITATGVFSNISSNILSTTTGIDAKVVATTNLYTVPTGKSAIITGVVIRCTTADTITVVPTLGIGIAAGEDDIMSSSLLTNLTATTKFYRYSVEGIAVVGAATNVIKLGIDTGATATTMTIAIDLMGYLI